MKLGICVLNWNAGTDLTDCVASLLDCTLPAENTLVVVDNDSADNSIAHLTSRIPGVQIISNPRNFGFSKGHNIGARHLLADRCTMLLFVNPDVVVAKWTISGLLDTILASPLAGCCGGLPRNENGVSRMACRTRPSLYEKLVLYSPLSRVPFTRPAYQRHFLNPRGLGDGSDVFAICGALMLFRSEAFEQIGGFDEATFLYEEELIAAERLARSGWTTIVSPNCEYFHAEGRSTRQIPYGRRMRLVESEQYLLKEFYGLNTVSLLLWRLYRYLEWLPGLVRTILEPKAAA
jgi:GT2 family glycosyltransferase